MQRLPCGRYSLAVVVFDDPQVGSYAETSNSGMRPKSPLSFSRILNTALGIQHSTEFGVSLNGQMSTEFTGLIDNRGSAVNRNDLAGNKGTRW